jgi:hypothetical protein
MIIEAGGARQLIIFHPTAIDSLDPATGKLLWDVPFTVELNLSVVLPVYNKPYLFVVTHYSGIRCLKLDETKPGATLAWQTKSGEDEINPWSSTPIIDGDYVYGVNSFGVLRCLDLKTGKRMWESQAATKEHAMWASAYFVRNGDRVFIRTIGELIIALSCQRRATEIGRTKVITPTHPQPRRRERSSSTGRSLPTRTSNIIPQRQRDRQLPLARIENVARSDVARPFGRDAD